jgi:ribosomal-protein-alanine N-acetyltransferase
MIIPTPTTSRLTLRSLQPSDAPNLHCIYQIEGVFTYFPSTSPPPLEKVEAFIVGKEKHWQTYGSGNWASCQISNNEISGWVGLQFLPELNETKVSPPYKGKGYATKAALASFHFGFEQFYLNHSIVLVHPENMASQQVIQKCRMSYPETIHLWGVDLMRHRLERSEQL